MTQVVVVVGAGSIGQAIARRIGVGKTILLADLNLGNAEAAAKVLNEAGYVTRTSVVDVSSRQSVEALVAAATALGEVSNLIQAAGVSPSQAPIETILKVDLYGTALLLEVFGQVIAQGGSGVVISSQSGHRMGPSPLTKTGSWRPRRSTPCSTCRSYSPARSRTPCTPTSCRSAATGCACRPRQ
jgi:NAD(P)-dependent dehydrogenase (short-subunit alcohol dehydrogenase family)